MREAQDPDFFYKKRGEGASVCSEEVAFGNCAKDANSHARDYEGAENGLDEDGILDLAKSRLLNPDLAIKDLADKVALLVTRHPWLVFVRITRCMRFKAHG